MARFANTPCFSQRCNINVKYVAQSGLLGHLSQTKRSMYAADRVLEEDPGGESAEESGAGSGGEILDISGSLNGGGTSS